MSQSSWSVEEKWGSNWTLTVVSSTDATRTLTIGSGQPREDSRKWWRNRFERCGYSRYSAVEGSVTARDKVLVLWREGVRMIKRNAEVAFDALLTLSVGVGVVTHMLGLLVRPVLAVGFGIGLVVLGARLLVPHEEHRIAGFVGTLTVLLAGVAVPRTVASVTWPIDELAATVALSGLLLVVTFAVLRITVFDRARPNTV